MTFWTIYFTGVIIAFILISILTYKTSAKYDITLKDIFGSCLLCLGSWIIVLVFILDGLFYIINKGNEIIIIKKRKK